MEVISFFGSKLIDVLILSTLWQHYRNCGTAKAIYMTNTVSEQCKIFEMWMQTL